MTTEIAIMNRRGIALAADSVSSLVVTDEIREEDKVKKTYSNMKKLFNISQDYPVGIMTYSSANFMSIPWEVIIEDFRKEIVNNNYRYNSLEEYGDKLINYIKNNYQLSGDDFKGFLFKKYYRRLLVKIARKIYWELKDAEDKGNRQQIHERVVEEFLKELGDSECNLELQKSELKKIKQFVDEGLPELIEDVIGKKYVSDKMISNLKTIALEIIRKEKMINPSYIVVAGFGECDLFPAAVEYSIDLLVDGHLKYKKLNEYRIDFENTATVLPFADGKMVHTFMRGIDEEQQQHIMYLINKGLYKFLPDKIEEKCDIEQEILDNIKQETNRLMEEFDKMINYFTREKYINPVLDNVEHLSKKEMAEMARSLVFLSVFKKRASMEEETVGGEIKVGVISRGQGYEWVKK